MSSARNGPRLRLAALLGAYLWVSVAWAASPASTRPNIVLVVIDDASPTDLGAYGGEIATPNIDRLALNGARFTNFHASPMCAPSRAMLLSGLDSHTAGVANLPESVPAAHEGRPGYLGHFANKFVTIASLLHRSGYHTYAAGKWHLGHTPGALPGAQGFEHSFIVDATGADNWEQRPYLPIYDDAPWFQDDLPVRLPKNFYSSAFLVDRIIADIDHRPRDGEPFFAYLPFLAIHIPVQAPAAFTAHYRGVYTGGWDVQRQRRHSGALRSGLVSTAATMRPQPAGLREWRSLNADQRTRQAQAMAVNAGMLEAMDHHLGRLIAYLQRTGDFANTLFVVLADNGPEPSDPVAQPLFRLWLAGVGYSTDPARLGTRGTFAAIGPEAASANAAPFALFKFHAAEGGLRVPLIISGPGIVPGRRIDAFAYITDLAPTFLAVTGTAPAAAPSPPLPGHSLVPLLAGSADQVHSPDETIALEAAGSAAVFKAQMKLVRDLPPFGDDQWHLYDLRTDPGETSDLRGARPAVVHELTTAYARYAASVGVLEVPPGYSSGHQVTTNIVRALLRRHALALSLTGLGALALLTIVLWRARGRWSGRARAPAHGDR